MNKIFSLFLLCTLFVVPLSMEAQIDGTIEKSVYFETTEASLNAESQRIIAELTESLKAFQYYKITMLGSAETMGSDPQHKALTDRRMASIRAYFLTNGVLEDAFGDETDTPHAAADTSSKIRQASNRRIDIQVEYIRVVSRVVDKLFEELESPMQIFQITAQQDTTLVGEKGTIVHIPASAFDAPKGTVVTFKMRESLTMSDFLFDNLSTASKDKILFSSGMLYLEAAANNKKVGLKAPLTISMPTNRVNPAMEFFKGKRDPHNQQVNWTAANNKGITPLGFPRLQVPTNQRYHYEYILETVKNEVCDSLTAIYMEPQKERKITEYKYDNRGFWEKFRDFFKGKSKDQTEKIERLYTPKPVPRYRVADSLSDNCKMMAKFAIDRGLGAATWQTIHLQYRDKWYFEVRAKTYQQLLANLEFEIKAHQKIYERKMIAFERQKQIRKKAMERAIEHRIIAGNVTVEDMNAYVFQTNSLGFINCDAFYSVPPERMIVMGTNEIPTPFADVKLVFKKRKSILPCTILNNKLVFRNIPKDEEAVIVAFKMENGKPYLAMQDVVTTSEVQNLVYKPTTVANLREKVKTLDGL